jgi:hypothetical protein
MSASTFHEQACVFICKHRGQGSVCGHGTFSVLSEVLWFQFGMYCNSDRLEQCFPTFSDLKQYLLDHPFLFDYCGLFDFNYFGLFLHFEELFPGIKLCVKAWVLSPQCEPDLKITSFHTYAAFTVEKTIQDKEYITFYGTVNGKWFSFQLKKTNDSTSICCLYDFALAVRNCLYSWNHFQLALAYSKYWREQGNEQYQELSKCLESPEFTSLVHQKYYDAKVMTHIIKDYLVHSVSNS